MKQFSSVKNLEVRFINEDIGYGVFTTEPIKKGETIEICYCLEFNNHLGEFLDYLFIHPVTKKKLMVLGFGMIYNHDKNGNMLWYYVEENQKLIRFYATRDINVNEELRHDYGDLYWETRQKKLI